MDINLRPATRSDAPTLAKISLLAAGGTFELLLKGLKWRVTPEMVLTTLCEAENTEYSYHYYQLVEVDKKIAGGVNYVSVEDRYQLAPNINPIVQEKFKFGILQLFLFLRRARHLRGMNEIRAPKNSLHINDIAVFPEYQGLGLGKRLVQFVIDNAKQRGFEYVSLYVWADNNNAIEFYKKMGFEISKTAQVRRHRFLPHDGSHLMLKKVN